MFTVSATNATGNADSSHASIATNANKITNTTPTIAADGGATIEEGEKTKTTATAST